MHHLCKRWREKFFKQKCGENSNSSFDDIWIHFLAYQNKMRGHFLIIFSYGEDSIRFQIMFYSLNDLWVLILLSPQHGPLCVCGKWLIKIIITVFVLKTDCSIYENCCALYCTMSYLRLFLIVLYRQVVFKFCTL